MFCSILLSSDFKREVFDDGGCIFDMGLGDGWKERRLLEPPLVSDLSDCYPSRMVADEL